jgi:hypothetical protein
MLAMWEIGGQDGEKERITHRSSMYRGRAVSGITLVSSAYGKIKSDGEAKKKRIKGVGEKSSL